MERGNRFDRSRDARKAFEGHSVPHLLHCRPPGHGEGVTGDVTQSRNEGCRHPCGGICGLLSDLLFRQWKRTSVTPTQPRMGRKTMQAEPAKEKHHSFIHLKQRTEVLVIARESRMTCN